MNKRIKLTWVRALRSGKYEQGKQALKKNDKYCCLGVLCEIGIKSKAKDAPHVLVTSVNDRINFNGRHGFPDETIENWAGITTENALHLSRMNDSGKSFTEIADWIEANL